jgi:HK97 family phage prohead protease
MEMSEPIVVPQVVRCATAAEVVHADRGAMRMKHVITTGMLNRNRHRVIQGGGDFSDYKKNPIVLFNHDSDRPAIGKNVGLSMEGSGERGRIIAETEFAPTEFGRELFALYEGRYMNSWSIGFQGVEVTFVKNDAGDVTEIVFNKWKLFEYSAVPIPANPDAVTQALRHKLISESTFRLLTYTDDLTPEEAKSEPGFPESALNRLVTMRLRVRAASDRLLEG